MTDQEQHGTELAPRIPEREPAGGGHVTVRARPARWDRELERVPRQAERFLRELDRSRRS